MPVNKISYLRFLNLLDALDRMNPGKKLDCTEESLLDKIILSHQAKESVLVGDLISLSALGSQATLHGRLKNLNAMGYIKMAANVDGRKKEVVPTKLALRGDFQMLREGCKSRLINFLFSLSSVIKKPFCEGFFITED